MTRRQARLEAAKRKGQRQADDWNERYPVGTPVTAYPLTLPGENPHFFQQLDTATRTPAWILGHGEPVVSVEGYAGGICLTHVDPIVTPRTIAALDVPAAVVEQQLARDVCLKAMDKTFSPSDRIAYANDLYLLAHPEACSTDADYPEWAAGLALQTAKNRTSRRAS
ncbi:hypothetical protein ACGFZA_07460 [Streptomyces sp. NPDC048211]|uniref:hypothetical protein n=1 Tax=Streptomyces sp. NPDC048211 TaxID=3365516 RepID=UPI00371C51E0